MAISLVDIERSLQRLRSVGGKRTMIEGVNTETLNMANGKEAGRTRADRAARWLLPADHRRGEAEHPHAQLHCAGALDQRKPSVDERQHQQGRLRLRVSTGKGWGPSSRTCPTSS